MNGAMDRWQSLLAHLSWMSPALGLALAAGLVCALVYAVVTARPLWALPFYWCLGMAGFAAGQAIALKGPRWWPVGDLALGTGVVACIVLFTAVHGVTVWYTANRRMRPRVRPEHRRREKVHR